MVVSYTSTAKSSDFCQALTCLCLPLPVPLADRCGEGRQAKADRLKADRCRKTLLPFYSPPSTVKSHLLSVDSVGAVQLKQDEEFNHTAFHFAKLRILSLAMSSQGIVAVISVPIILR